MAETRTVITLELDADDLASVRAAIDRRKAFPVGVPDGDSNEVGAVIAEIARGFLEMLDAGPHQQPHGEAARASEVAAAVEDLLPLSHALYGMIDWAKRPDGEVQDFFRRTRAAGAALAKAKGV